MVDIPSFVVSLALTRFSLVGTLSVDFTYSRKRVGEEEAEGSPSKKQAMSPGDAPDGGNHPEDMDIDYQRT